MLINIKNIVKFYKNNHIAIKGFRKYAKQGALIYVEEIDEFTYKIFLLNKDELIGDKITSIKHSLKSVITTMVIK